MDWLSETCNEEHIDIRYIATKYQTADILTKHFTKSDQWVILCLLMNIKPLPHRGVRAQGSHRAAVCVRLPRPSSRLRAGQSPPALLPMSATNPADEAPFWWPNAVGDHVLENMIPPWSRCPLKQMLEIALTPDYVRKQIHLFFYNAGHSSDELTENFGQWISKADMFSKTIARHHSNTPLLGALDMYGLTPNVFANTAKILRRIQGMHVIEPILQTWHADANAVGDHVRRINLKSIQQLINASEKRVIICGDSALNVGKGRTPEPSFRVVCDNRAMNLISVKACSGARCSEIADTLIETICQKAGISDSVKAAAQNDPRAMPLYSGYVVCFCMMNDLVIETKADKRELREAEEQGKMSQTR